MSRQPKIAMQGVLNATAYFQVVVRDVLNDITGRQCMLWVNDIVFCAKDAEALPDRTAAAVLERLIERGRFAAVHEALLFHREIN